MHIRRHSTIFLSFATVLSLALVGATARADVVTDWNVIATTAIPAGGAVLDAALLFEVPQ